MYLIHAILCLMLWDSRIVFILSGSHKKYLIYENLLLQKLLGIQWFLKHLNSGYFSVLWKSSVWKQYPKVLDDSPSDYQKIIQILGQEWWMNMIGSQISRTLSYVLEPEEGQWFHVQLIFCDFFNKWSTC